MADSDRNDYCDPEKTDQETSFSPVLWEMPKKRSPFHMNFDASFN